MGRLNLPTRPALATLSRCAMCQRLMKTSRMYTTRYGGVGKECLARAYLAEQADEELETQAVAARDRESTEPPDNSNQV